MKFINKTWNEADIITHFVDEHLGITASAEDVAMWLNRNVPQEMQVTRATTYNWMADIHEPGWKYLIAYTEAYEKKDPRYQMAKAIWDLRMAGVRAFLQGVPA